MAPTMARVIEEPKAVPTDEQIANLAYSLWEARGGPDGSPEEDWLAAEAELRRV
jgi:hypothetical protein